ncbi:MAG: ATP-dependent zinc metalloprotease FtsH [Bacteroidales bacterium]|nr:ATP-dependent zinc metalloprotease FtsH [Bacteroidales bacterium]
MPLPPPRPIRPNNNGKKNRFGFSMFWMYAVVIIFIMGFYFFENDTKTREISYTEFKKIGDTRGFTKIVVLSDKKQAEGFLTDSAAKKQFSPQELASGAATGAKVIAEIPSADKFDDVIEGWRASGAFNGNVRYDNDRGGWSSILWTFGPVILLIAFWFFIMKRMSGGGGGANSVFNVGKSKAQVFDKNNADKVTFKDVAGLSEAKTEIEEIVEFLKNPQRYTDLGGKIPKGALLVGPPGTGKTLLAKAVAGEANVPFFSMSGSDFVEMFVGVGASRVRDLFRQAKEKAPCIIFIDEIDAVGRARGRNPNMGSNDERENTLNQLLTEMDGFGSNSGVICLAATNRVDILDKALLRAGRFDRQIYVDLPDVNDRVAIFGVHLRKIKKDENLDIELLARQTAGFSGADIANVCNEAALIAARNNKSVVTLEDFNAAIDRIIGGLEKKSKITTAEEKRGISVHEAGHATVSWHLQYGDPLVKVTIVPRGKALGAAWYLPEERQLVPAQALLDKICSLMGGRAAEDLFLGQVATGALNDLERATKIAYSLVVYYGMSEKIPNISYYDSTGQDYGFSKPYSEERSKVIDQEVSRILNEQYQRAKDILLKYKDGHAKLTEELYDREVIFTADVEAIFGKRPWVSRTDEIMALNEHNPENKSGDTEHPESEDISAKEKKTTSKTPPALPPAIKDAESNG